MLKRALDAIVCVLLRHGNEINVTFGAGKMEIPDGLRMDV